MKSHALVIFLMWSTLHTTAQITLTNFHTFDIGTSATFIGAPAVFEELVQNGENVTWDASADGIQPNVMSYSLASDAQNAILFPGTNIAVTNTTENWEEFYEITNNVVINHGYVAEDFAKRIYTDPVTELILPMTYGDSFTDTFEHETEYIWGDISLETGTVEVTADAHGDLILPYGTLENTLRVKYVRIGEEKQYGYVWTNTFVYYKWYDLEYGNEIAFFSIQEDLGNEPFLSFRYISEMDYTSIKDQSSANKLKIYPNPTSEYFQISGADSGSEYELINQQGQAVLSGFLSEEERIYTTEFSTGIYFLEIKNNKGVTRKKIVVQ